jgi:hypothetical protein
VPEQINLPVLGTQTEDVLELDRKYLANEDAFKKKVGKLCKKRELKGEGSIYSSMQPFVQPEISDLMNVSIDVLSEFKMLDNKTSESDGVRERWCIYIKNSGCHQFVCIGIQFQIVLAERVTQNGLKTITNKME